MNEVSIIINGVRYDAVKREEQENLCDGCDFYKNCILADSCENMIGLERVFKKSDKKFEPCTNL